jgi:hypothetical protein
MSLNTAIARLVLTDVHPTFARALVVADSPNGLCRPYPERVFQEGLGCRVFEHLEQETNCLICE